MIASARPVGTLYLDPPSRKVAAAWPVINTDAYSQVSRYEIMATAVAYLNHTWRATEANRFHGVDPDGVRVDTPDAAFPAPSPTSYPGWWQPGGMNQGIPYQWGGFSSLEEFDRGIAAGKFAGDVATPWKRQVLEGGVSRYAVGIDCSGFISRCWKLPRPFSTRELPGLCERVVNWDDLRPGDILNTRNEHVILFARWNDPQRLGLLVYETGCPPTWKVFRRALKRRPLLEYGYEAYRYRNVVD